MIRPATPADRAAICALHVASWQDSYTDTLPASYLRDGLPGDMVTKWAARHFSAPELTFVAQDGATITGFVCALTDRTPPLIDNLHVRPGLRGSGTGAKLLTTALDALRRAGFARAYLTVLDTNIAAQRFYLRHGGQDEGAVEDEIVGYAVQARRIGFALAHP